MIRTGVIGYGYWGPNLVRNFAEAADAEVGAISDSRQTRLDVAAKRCPGAFLTRDAKELIHHPDIDAVAISTPVSTHFELALEALRAGKHVLVEKPMTSTSREAEILIGEAAKRNLVLMVDHTFVYTGAVRKMREMVQSGEMGDIYYYDSTRVNLGLFQSDVNVVWDLAVHDLAIMDFTLPFRPCAVSATGISHVEGGPENVAYITAFFEEKLIAHINVNWLSPVKIRQTLLSGSRKMIVYDDLEGAEKIKIYDKGITLNQNQTPENIYKLMVGYRTGDMTAPKLDGAEALGVEAKHFVACIEGREQPITGGEAGLSVVRILEAASESMRGKGKLVELAPMKKAKA